MNFKNYKVSFKPETPAITLLSNGIFTTNASVHPIDGLGYTPNFLTPKEQQRIMDVIDRHESVRVIHRNQQFYGRVYYHTTHDCTHQSIAV